MTIRFRCQQIARYDAERQGYVRCGHEFEVSNEQAGETVTCPECGNNVEVPIGIREVAESPISPARQPDFVRPASAETAKNRPSQPQTHVNASIDQQLLTPGATPLEYASFHRQFACEACGAQIRPGMAQCPGCHRLLSPNRSTASLDSYQVQPAGVQRFLMRLLSPNASIKTTRLLMDGFVIVPAILISLGAIAALGFFAVFVLPPLLGLVAGYVITVRHSRRMMAEPGLPLLPWQRYVWNASMPVFRSFGWAIPGARNQPVIDLRARDMRGVDFQVIEGISAARVLDLTDAQITDTELSSLHTMKQLRGISLIGTQVTDEGAFRLQQSLLNTWIWY